MTQTATLLLLLAGEPTPAERALLAEFAHKRHVSLVAPAPTPSAPYPAYRRDLVLDLEGRLDEARTLASSLDEERASEMLRSVERDVLLHPELPQAAWLLAEHHRIAADLARLAHDGAALADALDREASALEGPRTAAFGAEGAFAAPAQPIALRVDDLDARDTLELDGVSGGAARSVEPGTHQLRVLRDGELVFAAFRAVTHGGGLSLGVPALVPCSTEDLARVTHGGEFVRGTTRVRCPNFLVARRAGPHLEVAECWRAACTKFTPLEPAERRLAPWATVALVTAGALVAMTAVTWAAGGFEREPAADKTVFVYGGLR
jgi:hypothetical protein